MNIKIYIKTAPTCFGVIIIIRKRTEVTVLKQSVKIHQCV